jgi:hypothetical protein
MQEWAQAMCAVSAHLGLAVYRGAKPHPFDRQEAIEAIDKARSLYEPWLPCALCRDEPEAAKTCPATLHHMRAKAARAAVDAPPVTERCANGHPLGKGPHFCDACDAASGTGRGRGA